MLRLAYFSPLPPAHSGIADYSCELLPYLAQHAHIDLVVDDGCVPTNDLSTQFSILGLEEYCAAARTQPYDAVIYQIGNDPRFHGYVYDTALRHPGIVVLHEYMIHHLIRGVTLARGDPESYVAEMRHAYGRQGERLARRQVDTGRGLDVWSHPLFERIVDASLGVIVHSEYARQRILESRPLARVSKINHHYSAAGLPDGREDATCCRDAVGLPRDAFVVATFGLITRQKRVTVCLRAFSRFRQRFPGALLVLVGDKSPHYDLQSALDGSLGEGVIVTGRVGMKALENYMASTDLAVNLRFPTAGETSGSVIRLLGLGKPVIVSNVGSFAEFPDDCCAKIDLGDAEEDMLYTMMCALAEDETLRRRMGANARSHILTQHTLEGSAQGYIDFIGEVLASPEPGPTVPAGTSRVKAEAPLSGLIEGLSAEMAELGIQESDDRLLREIAVAVVDLGLDLPGRMAESGKHRSE